MIKTTLTEFGIVDTWRELHPFRRDYTHYSHYYDSYARIDFFLWMKKELYRVKKCQNEEADVTDHCAVYLKVKLKTQDKSTLWRLNVGILNNKPIVEERKKDIRIYQKENDNGELSPVNLWDALNAVTRGKHFRDDSH